MRGRFSIYNSSRWGRCFFLSFLLICAVWGTVEILCRDLTVSWVQWWEQWVCIEMTRVCSFHVARISVRVDNSSAELAQAHWHIAVMQCFYLNYPSFSNTHTNGCNCRKAYNNGSYKIILLQFTNILRVIVFSTLRRLETLHVLRNLNIRKKD